MANTGYLYLRIFLFFAFDPLLTPEFFLNLLGPSYFLPGEATYSSADGRIIDVLFGTRGSPLQISSFLCKLSRVIALPSSNVIELPSELNCRLFGLVGIFTEDLTPEDQFFLSWFHGDNISDAVPEATPLITFDEIRIPPSHSSQVSSSPVQKISVEELLRIYQLSSDAYQRHQILSLPVVSSKTRLRTRRQLIDSECSGQPAYTRLSIQGFILGFSLPYCFHEKFRELSMLSRSWHDLSDGKSYGIFNYFDTYPLDLQYSLRSRVEGAYYFFHRGHRLFAEDPSSCSRVSFDWSALGNPGYRQIMRA